MIYSELTLQPKWFSESTPKNPHKASATLTFTGNVVAAETVTINNVVFEFVVAKGDIAKETNIPVVVGATLTGKNAVEKLAIAINDSLDFVVATADVDDSENNICIINYYKVGTEGNVVTVAETCTSATFGTSVTKLSGGQLGTPCPVANTVIYKSPYYYWCVTAGNEDNVAWTRFTPADY